MKHGAQRSITNRETGIVFREDAAVTVQLLPQVLKNALDTRCVFVQLLGERYDLLLAERSERHEA